MITLIVAASIAVYVVGWYVSSLRFARRLIENDERNGYSYRSAERDASERRLLTALGMLLGLIWPVLVPLWALHSAMVPRVGPTRQQVELENDELRDRIADLERELGVGR